MKKTILLLLVLSLCLSLVGCGKAESSASAAELSEKADAADYSCSLSLTREELPRLDGSTSTVPLAKAVCAAVLGEPEDSVEELVQFNRTTRSFRNLMEGSCDMLLVGEPNAAVYTEMEEQGFACETRTIATDALVFVVNKDNPIDDLTTDQLRQIYAGEITNWKELGGEDAPIAAFQRNENAGSQALMIKLVMGDTPLMEAPTEYVAGSMGDLMSGVKNYDNAANAIGYSVYYYANDMKMAQGLKLLSVDGVAPSPETIRSGEYPHRNAYYAVIPANAGADSGARRLYDWLLTDEGQALIFRLGYVSVRDFGTAERESAPDIYTPLGTGELIPQSGDGGPLIPYVGEALYSGGEYGRLSGLTYGMMNSLGAIVCDSVYTSVAPVTGDADDGVLWWKLGKTENVTLSRETYGEEVYEELTGDTLYALASADGTVVTDRVYVNIIRQDDRLFCIRSYETQEYDVLDLEGDLVLTQEDVPAFIRQGGCLLPEYCQGRYVAGVTKNAYYLLDEDMNILAGPCFYMWLDGSYIMFRDKTSELCGLLDRDGNEIIPPVYHWLCWDENGLLWGDLPDGSKELLRADGTLLRSFGHADVSYSAFGYEICTKGEEASVCYDTEGNEICTCGEGEWEYTGTGRLFTRRENGETVIWDYDTGRRVTIPADACVYSVYTDDSLSDDICQDFLWAHSVGSAPGSTYLIRIADLTVTELGTRYASVITDPVTGRRYLTVTDNAADPLLTSTELLDSDGSSLGHYTGKVSVCNDCVRVTDRHTCTVYRPDGSILFRRTLNSLGED